ncbi:MAG: hypothetical protein ACK56F_21180, partial [bacterium]
MPLRRLLHLLQIPHRRRQYNYSRNLLRLRLLKGFYLCHRHFFHWHRAEGVGLPMHAATDV